MLNGTEGCAHSHKERVSVGGQPPARSRQTAPSTHALTRSGSVQLQRNPLRIVNAVHLRSATIGPAKRGLHSADDDEYAIQSAANGKARLDPQIVTQGSLPFRSKKSYICRAGLRATPGAVGDLAAERAVRRGKR